MKLKLLVLVCAISILPTAEAGVWDRVKGTAAQPWGFVKATAASCGERLSSGRTAVVSAATGRVRRARLVKPVVTRKLRRLARSMTPIYTQVCEIGGVGRDCGMVSVRTVATEVGPMIARVVGFEGRFDDIKRGIVLPLLSRVRDVREARDRQLPTEELWRRLTSLAFFTVEIGFKIPRFLPMAAQGVLAGAVGGLTIGLTNDIPSWGTTIASQFEPEKGASLTGTDLTRMLIGDVVNHIRRALTEPDLTLTQRLGKIVSVETILVEWFRVAGATAGWDDVETELAAWRRQQGLPVLLLEYTPALEVLEPAEVKAD